jgi:hypothetical protein
VPAAPLGTRVLPGDHAPAAPARVRPGRRRPARQAGHAARQARDDRHRLLSRAYFELLSRHGLLRDDLEVDAIAYAFQATFEGFLHAEAAAMPTTAGHAASGLDQRADLLARTVQRAFESWRTIPRREQSLATAVIDLLTDLTDADRADLGVAEA